MLPVHEEILFLTTTTVCNVQQSEIVKWRCDHDTTIVIEEKDVFTLSLLEETELVERVTGTERFGVVLTNQNRVWLIEGWTSQYVTHFSFFIRNLLFLVSKGLIFVLKGLLFVLKVRGVNHSEKCVRDLYNHQSLK